jgi:hypothetical protein
LAKLETTRYCAKHADRLGVALCDRCGAPFCAAQGCRFEDIVTDEEFCSQYCKDQHTKAQSGLLAATDYALLEGFEHPIKTGWRLWARSVRDLCLYTAPLAFVMGLLGSLIPGPEGVTGAESFRVLGGTAIFLLLMFAFGIALTQVILSQQYTGLVKGNPYWWTLQRFIPWALTAIIALAAAFLGMLAFIVPGIIIGLRLFWADEFALVHQAGPLDAITNSWQLTRGKMGAIFIFQFLAGLASSVVLIGGGVIITLSNAAIQVLGSSYSLELVELTVAYLVIFVGYGSLHGPEIAYFYGMRTRSVVRSTKEAHTPGDDRAERICSSCKATIPASDRFCGHCGAALMQ